MTDLSDDGTRSLELPFRVAAIDLGSNAIRVVAARFSRPEEPETILSERLPIRLGGGTILDTERIRETIAALRGVSQRLDELGVRAVRAVATSAVRESSNRADLIDGARTHAGIEIEAISGEEEGMLVWEALRASLPESRDGWLLADLGGGSLELSFAAEGALRWTRSLPLGTVRLLSALDGARTSLPAAEARRRVLERVGSVPMPGLPETVAGLVATGGNADALARLAGSAANGAGMRFLPLALLRELTDGLAGLPWEERMARFDLRDDRADVIVPAGIVLTHLAEAAGVEGIWVAGQGLKEGVILRLARAILVGGDGVESRHARRIETEAVALGRRLRFDEERARHVCRFALRLFDGLQPLHRLTDADRALLTAATLLSEADCAGAAARRHPRAPSLIAIGSMQSLGQEEREQAMMIARYHDGSRRRRAYRTLPSSGRRRVRILGTLLRIAKTLGSHRELRVSEIGVSVAPQRGETDQASVLVRLLLPDAPDVREPGLSGAARRQFEREFSRSLRVVSVRDPASTSTSTSSPP